MPIWPIVPPPPVAVGNLVQNGPKWSKSIKNGSKWFKMVQNGSKLFKMDRNGPKWSKMRGFWTRSTESHQSNIAM